MDAAFEQSKLAANDVMGTTIKTQPKNRIIHILHLDRIDSSLHEKHYTTYERKPPTYSASNRRSTQKSRLVDSVVASDSRSVMVPHIPAAPLLGASGAAGRV
jgi:hypothetical protein